MPRLDPLPPTVLSTDHRALLERLNELLGFECNDWLTLARVPPIMAAAMNLCAAALEAAADCGGDLRWLVCYAASRAFGCQYCVAHSAFTASRLGVPEAKLVDIERYQTSPAYTEEERAAIGVAIGIGRCPTAVSDAQFDALRRHFTEAQIVSIVGLAAMMGFFNRWNDAMATELEAQPRAYAERMLARTGWQAGKHGSSRAPAARSATREIADKGRGEDG